MSSLDGNVESGKSAAVRGTAPRAGPVVAAIGRAVEIRRTAPGFGGLRPRESELIIPVAF